MNKKEQEIQRKLQELENNVLSESTELSVSQGRSDMMATGKKSLANSANSGDPITRSDGAYFGGLGLIALGLVMVFQQIKVAPSILSMLGFAAESVDDHAVGDGSSTSDGELWSPPDDLITVSIALK